MDVSFLVAHTANNVVLEHETRNEHDLKPDWVIVKIAYSAISAGTELAWISGNSNNPSVKPFPFYPGYSSVGEIVKVGSEVDSLAVGDKVVVPWGGHRSYSFVQASRVHKISDPRIDLRAASLCHIASFPMLGVRRLQIQMGEAVMIAGLGLLGLVALQAARLSGAAPLLACDLSPERRKLALELGADAVFDPTDKDFIEQVKAASGGKGVAATVEVTGKAIALQQALKYTAKMGRVSLLGCTRIPDCPIDFYRDVHLPGISIIGAHTSNRPPQNSRTGEWTESDDYATILKYLATGRFDFSKLINRVESPADAPQVYTELLSSKTPQLGFVFDWSKID
jgi:2-desacetyl-2-hydroxyethyl bacteriochlorophyllide A dehydrogenase